MPYKIVNENGKFVVKKKEDDKVMGTHESRTKAERQIAAIYANTKEAYKSDIYSILKHSELTPDATLQLLATAGNLEDVRKREYNEILKDKLWNFILPEVIQEAMLVDSDVKIDKKHGGQFLQDALQTKLQQYFAGQLLTEQLMDANPQILEYMAQLQRLAEMDYLRRTPASDMTADDIINNLGGSKI